MHEQADCQAVAAKPSQLRSVSATAPSDGRQGCEILSCFWRHSAEALIPGPTSPESARPPKMVHASPVLSWALVVRGQSQQNRSQIEQTRSPVGEALRASLRIIPARLRPGDPCDAPRRSDPAAAVVQKIAHPERMAKPSPNAAHSDPVVREYPKCHLGENPTAPREQPWKHALPAARPERSPHNCRRQCEKSSLPLMDRSDPAPA